MNALVVLAFLPLVLLAMVFDVILALSVLGWAVFFANGDSATAEVLDLLAKVLR